MKKTIVFRSVMVLILLGYNVNLFGQKSKAGSPPEINIVNNTGDKIEFELSESVLNSLIGHNLGGAGFMYSFASDEKTENNEGAMLYFIKFSTNMEMEYMEGVVVKKGFKMRRACIEGDNIYYLLSATPRLGAYQVLRFNFVNKEAELYDGSLKSRTEISQFWVRNGIYYLTGNHVKDPMIFCAEYAGCFTTIGLGYLAFGWGTRSYDKPIFASISDKSSPPSFTEWKTNKNKQISVISASLPDSANYADLVISEQLRKLKQTWYMKVQDGEYSKPVKLQFKKDIMPFSLISHTFSESENYITGLFSGTEKVSFTKGIYFAQLDNGKLKNLNAIPFNKIKSYKDLTFSKQAKVMKNQEKGKRKSAAFSLYAYQHHMFKSNDQFILINEFYYPTYHTETRTTIGANGKSTTTTVEVFDGYQYTSVLLMAFDQNGKVLWEKTLKLDEMSKYFTVRERVKVMGDADGNLVFVYNGRKVLEGSKKEVDVLVSATFDGKEFGEKDYVSVAEKLELDKIDAKKVETTYSIEYWYDDLFIAFGTKKLKNVKKGDKKNKTVFFLQKLQF